MSSSVQYSTWRVARMKRSGIRAHWRGHPDLPAPSLARLPFGPPSAFAFAILQTQSALRACVRATTVLLSPRNIPLQLIDLGRLVGDDGLDQIADRDDAHQR